MAEGENVLPAKPTAATAPPKRKKLGEILAERGIITNHTVERILTLSQSSGRRFGTVLEDLGLVTGSELAQALAFQYDYKVANDFSKYNFPESVLKLIPMEAALEHTIFPLQIQNNTLALAMTDPTNLKVIKNLQEDLQMQVNPVISTRTDINAAIAKHYLKQAMPEKEEKTILVVDDDKLFLKIITGMLENFGHKIIVATDGLEAFKRIVCNKPRLIITDKEMPKFNGYALLDSLKHLPDTKNIPIILVSCSTNPDEEAIACEKGFFDYISKPLIERAFKAKVNRALNSRNPFSLVG